MLYSVAHLDAAVKRRYARASEEIMGKDAMLAVRLPAETKAALDRMAKDDFRTLSSLIEKILTEAVRKGGYLSEPPKEPKK